MRRNSPPPVPHVARPPYVPCPSLYVPASPRRERSSDSRTGRRAAAGSAPSSPGGSLAGRAAASGVPTRRDPSIRPVVVVVDGGSSFAFRLMTFFVPPSSSPSVERSFRPALSSRAAPPLRESAVLEGAWSAPRPACSGVHEPRAALPSHRRSSWSALLLPFSLRMRTRRPRARASRCQ